MDGSLAPWPNELINHSYLYRKRSMIFESRGIHRLLVRLDELFSIVQASRAVIPLPCSSLSDDAGFFL